MAIVSSAERAEAAAGRASAIQLRMPGSSARDLETEAQRVRSRVRLPLIVSDRIDVAAAVGAAGVNLPESGLPVSAARRILASGVVGRSVHSIDSALRAQGEGCDYVIFGPVRPTTSHPEQAAQGWDRLGEVAAALSIPVIAIGGLGESDLAHCLELGAAGFAAIGYFEP